MDQEKWYKVEPDIELPSVTRLNLLHIFTEDLNIKLTNVTTLVALQESELAALWFIVLSLLGYTIIKEYRER